MHAREQGDRGDDGRRHRHVDAQADEQRPGPVQPRRLFDGVVDVVERRHQDDQEEEAPRLRQDVDGEGVQQPEALEVQELRDQPGTEEQRDREDRQVDLSELQRALAQRERARRVHDDHHGDADRHAQDRHHQRVPQQRLPERELEVDQRPAPRQVQGDAVVEHAVQRVDEHEPERVEDQQREQRESGVHRDVEGHVERRYGAHGGGRAAQGRHVRTAPCRSAASSASWPTAAGAG